MLTEATRANHTDAGLNLIQRALSIYDSELKLEVSNRRFQEMFALPERYATSGSDFGDLFRYLVERGEYRPQDDPERAIRFRVDQALTYQPHYLERLRRDGSWISVEGSPLKQGGWEARFSTYMLVAPDGDEVPFSDAEGEVLRLFLESPKRLISRAQMQEALGGAAGESFDRAIDVRISRFRQKLGEDPRKPRLIKTIYGAGYIFLGEVTWI